MPDRRADRQVEMVVHLLPSMNVGLAAGSLGGKMAVG